MGQECTDCLDTVVLNSQNQCRFAVWANGVQVDVIVERTLQA
jgi:hypothetical protein